MATVEGWEEGGVFAWVSNTLGERWDLRYFIWLFTNCDWLHSYAVFRIRGTVLYFELART